RGGAGARPRGGGPPPRPRHSPGRELLPDPGACSPPRSCRGRVVRRAGQCVPLERRQYPKGGAMGLIVSLVIGGVIGWLASILMKTNAQMGIIANIVVGIVGSVLGGWLAGALGIVAVGSIGAWVISIIGDVILIAILKALNIYS